MHALVLKDVNQLEYLQVEKPSPKPGEALIKVMAAGVCGSDIPRVYRDGAHNMPLIIGHEFSGIVEDVFEASEGERAQWLGKRVGIYPLIPCGKCSSCVKGIYETCKNYDYLGSRRDGGFAEYVCAPIKSLYVIPENVSYKAAAMLEPMAVAVHAMRRVNPRCEETVAVCGLGTIGILLTMFLIERKEKNILVIGNKDFQKRIVGELGIPEENYCDSSKNDPIGFLMDHTSGEGVDGFFECVGKNETVSLAVDTTGAMGRICVVGNPYSDMLLEKNTYWKILRNQINISGTWNSDSSDWKYVIEKLESGLINPEALITHEYSLEKLPKGMEIMRDKTEDYVKVMCCVCDKDNVKG